MMITGARIDNLPPTKFAPDEADGWAAQMTADDASDDGWTYTAVRDPKTGRSVIRVCDEAGEYLGTL